MRIPALVVFGLGFFFADPAFAPEKSFTGLFATTYGRLRLVEREDAVAGVYDLGSFAKVFGKAKNGKLKFRYEEPAAKGEGWFQLSDDGRRLHGQWREDGTADWADWSGDLVQPVADQSWLVVIEAPWEENLADKEYSFGEMLKSFFARDPSVRIRHRHFSDERLLAQWLRETAFLAEPVVLVVAAHGSPEGLEVGGESIGPALIGEALKFSSNVRLLHFSACLLLKDAFAAKVAAAIGSPKLFPISGYSTAVDWTASALAEFMYLDLVLSRNMNPQEAAGMLPKLLPFAGGKNIRGSPFESLGFKFVN